MLRIVFKDDTHADWHVNEPSPSESSTTLCYGDIRDGNVNSVWADGHELDYICANFQNVPFRHDQRVVTWRGEMAQFIVENL
jgi:hypothetical protein